MFGIIWIFQHWASNLLSGFFGAFVGGAFTWFGAWQSTKTAFELQQKEFADREFREKLANQATIRGAVQSISDEVEALWKHYNREIRPHLACLEPERPANIYHAAQSYFVVFDAAGSLVGRIASQTLRSRIIDFYIGAKAFTDALQYYEGLHASHANISEYNQKSEKWKEIIRYSSYLKAMSADLDKLYDALKPEFNLYLNATPSDRTVYPDSIPKA